MSVDGPSETWRGPASSTLIESPGWNAGPTTVDAFAPLSSESAGTKTRPRIRCFETLATRDAEVLAIATPQDGGAAHHGAISPAKEKQEGVHWSDLAPGRFMAK
jgi:hypothetical protein